MPLVAVKFLLKSFYNESIRYFSISRPKLSSRLLVGTGKYKDLEETRWLSKPVAHKL